MGETKLSVLPQRKSRQHKKRIWGSTCKESVALSLCHWVLLSCKVHFCVLSRLLWGLWGGSRTCPRCCADTARQKHPADSHARLYSGSSPVPAVPFCSAVNPHWSPSLSLCLTVRWKVSFQKELQSHAFVKILGQVHKQPHVTFHTTWEQVPSHVPLW
jgi:hypothetical protein